METTWEMKIFCPGRNSAFERANVSKGQEVGCGSGCSLFRGHFWSVFVGHFPGLMLCGKPDSPNSPSDAAFKIALCAS
jgi:hypothetical protein